MAVADVDVRTGARIRRPVEVVSGYAMDPDTAPEWYANIRRAEWVTEPPLAVGSRVAFVARFLGRELRYTYEVVVLEPERRLVMRTAEGPFPMETSYTFEPVRAGETRVTLRNRGAPTGFSRLVSPLMALAMRRENRKDLARLKTILEAR